MRIIEEKMKLPEVDYSHGIEELKKQIEEQKEKASSFEIEYIDIIKYLYEICKAKVPDNAINNASSKGHLEVVKYLHKTCHADVETLQ